MTLHTPEDAQLSRTELARRYGVSVSAVSRALDKAAAAHQANPDLPPPPPPVNPGHPRPRYRVREMDPWWNDRPPVGRPRRDPAETTVTELGRLDLLLAVLRVSGNVVTAARQVGLHHAAVYGRMRRDADFQQQVEAALESFCQNNIPACGTARGYRDGGRCTRCRAAKRSPKPAARQER